MKIKGLVLVTPFEKIYFDLTEDSLKQEVNQELIDELAEGWEEIFKNIETLKIADKDGRYYIFPKNVLQNSYAYIELE